MAQQVEKYTDLDKSICFQTKKQFLEDNPAFTPGGLNWLLFHQKKELLEKRIVANFGSKLLINTPAMKNHVLTGGTEVIGGLKHDL